MDLLGTLCVLIRLVSFFVLVANYTLKIHFRHYSIDRIARKIMEPDLTRYIKLIKFRRYMRP
jgi:hypothetical protein